MMLEHLRNLKCLMLAVAAGAALALTGSGVHAQKASPEILAKERNDPAIGETVIINRRKPKSGSVTEAAPNPYAPAAKPKPEANDTAKEKTRDSRLGRFASPAPSRQPEPEQRAELPPLPEINRDVASVARPALRPRNDNDADGGDHSPRRSARRGADYWRNDDDRRDYGYVARRSRARPWRQCQRLAWRCEDGFERACIRWQRRC